MWANTCWGFLFLAIAAGTLIVTGVSPTYAWILPWLPWTTGFFVLCSLICFSFPILKRNIGQTIFSPPLGSFHYNLGIMEVHHKISTDRTAAQMKFAMFNNNNSVMKFHAKLTGTVNGKPSDSIEFSGYAYPKQEAILLYNRIVDVPIAPQTDIDTPSIIGILTYDIRYNYRSALCSYLSRRTSKTLIYNYWPPVITNVPRRHQEHITVHFANEIEE